MSAGWGPEASARLLVARQEGKTAAVDMILAASKPVAGWTIAVPAQTLAEVLADARADRDQARGEHGLLAAPGSAAAKAADAREKNWAARRPGYAALLALFAVGAR